MGHEDRPGAPVTDYIQCGHCARCLEVCPTYQALRIETLSSRGRWDLINGVAEGTLAGAGGGV